MTFVDLLGHHRGWSGRRCLELWSINNRRGLRLGHWRCSCGHVTDRHFVNLRVSCSRDPVDFDALVNDGPIVYDVVVDNRRVIVDARDFRRS